MHFIIKPQDSGSVWIALFTLSHYQVNVTIQSDGENVESTTLIVDDETRVGDLHLAEMAFQMNFKQVGNVCCICKDKGEDICGHLTFEGVV